MTVVEDTLVVQTRLPLNPSCLDRRAVDFLCGVKKAIQDAQKRYPPDLFQLCEIGFLPGSDFIEVKLYFRK